VTSVGEARVTPAEIRKKGGERITIRWGDGHESVYPARTLRGRCPCAQCVSETTGERMVFEEHIPEGVTIDAANLVGNYAIHFQFSDGHATGIYAFDYLRRICPCDACTGRSA
jgi:DUF971 family protein